MSDKTEKELIMLREIAKYIEENTQLKERIKKMHEGKNKASKRIIELKQLANKMAKSIAFMSNSQNENVSTRAKALHNEYERVMYGTRHESDL